MKRQKILILGVTASGKGRVAFELARKTSAEIISIDSMKVYRRMDIGTAKPPKEAREAVRYHLIDVAEPSESFSVGKFLDLANEVVDQITKRGKPVVAVGGTALYIKALLYGLFEGPGADCTIRDELKDIIRREGVQSLYEYLQRIDPVVAARISSNDQKRIVRAIEVYRLTGQPISAFQKQWQDDLQPLQDWFVLGLRRDKKAESSRINSRVKKMIDAGLVDEVKGLLAEDKQLSTQARCAIGYAEIIDYIEGRCGLDEAIELIKKNTRQFAKHQRTWFKRFADVHWLDIGEGDTFDAVLSRVMFLLGERKG